MTSLHKSPSPRTAASRRKPDELDIANAMPWRIEGDDNAGTYHFVGLPAMAVTDSLPIAEITARFG